MQTNDAVLTRKPQREYKDRLFRLLFSERRDLLELYNALCQKNYTDPDALKITGYSSSSACSLAEQAGATE